MRECRVLLWLIQWGFLLGCQNDPSKNTQNDKVTGYLNLHDTVKYVGMATCVTCHADKHQTFVHTGMGQSFGIATSQKSADNKRKHAPIYDKWLDFWYQPVWAEDSLKIMEFRLQGKDTVHKRIETVSYIIGSGQHTNSHLQITNGYLYQMPLTFYSQKKRWDLPPGFESGSNSRFSRKIGLECLTCHNSFPQMVVGSENKYLTIPEGITCERCHGPGELHVAQKKKGLALSKDSIDYSIVNPAKLPAELQFDLCQRCHLQGNTVLKKDKSFFSFRPGMKLHEVMTTFLPKYENADNEFIMASHVYRLKQSRCFIQSSQENKPLTCITCHNPHISVKATKSMAFNQVCQKCHTPNACRQTDAAHKRTHDNCTSCHMPRSGSTDIPHVTVTDHKIQIVPPKATSIQKVKRFLGLIAINEEAPDARTKTLAYLQQYERFEKQPFFLDSAQKFLPKASQSIDDLILLVHYYFLRQDYKQIITQVQDFGGIDNCLQKLNTPSYENTHAWCCYHIGEAYLDSRHFAEAAACFKQAEKLSPFNLDFKNKRGKVALDLGNNDAAQEIFQEIIRENPKYPQAYSNLGYLMLLSGKVQQGEALIKRSHSLDPDNEQILLNYAQVFILKKQYFEAKKMLHHALKKHPQSKKVQYAWVELRRFLRE